MSKELSIDTCTLPAALKENLPETADRSVLLDHISSRVAELMDRQSDLLFSLLYRMDVSETKIEEVLSGKTDESVPDGLARLILDRQIRRMETRKQYRKKMDDG